MRQSIAIRITTCVVGAILTLLPVSAAWGSESTMPDTFVEKVNPDLATKYVYSEDGEFSKALNMPTYQWMPADGKLRAVIVAVHGLTLHGRRYRVLARSLAVNGIGFIAFDMRGFGRCKFDKEKQFSTEEDDKTKVNHEKSYEALVQLTQLVKDKYPNLKLISVGESLGCTFCVRLAAEHPELLTGIVLSAPAIKVNPDMYAGKGQIRKGLKAVISPHHEMDLSSFFAQLVSKRKVVQDEMIDDPFVLKKLPLGALISTDKFVDKTVHWGKSTDKSLAVLILQGSQDGCVSPKHVTDLMNAMPSIDQDLAWRGNYGHLQLETIFMRAQTIDAIAGWLLNHGHDAQLKMKHLEQDIADLGGNIAQ